MGLELACLTTLRRLLELKLLEMEGPEGTGSLELDIQLLQVSDGHCVLEICLRSMGLPS